MTGARSPESTCLLHSDLRGFHWLPETQLVPMLAKTQSSKQSAIQLLGVNPTLKFKPALCSPYLAPQGPVCLSAYIRLHLDTYSPALKRLSTTDHDNTLLA